MKKVIVGLSIVVASSLMAINIDLYGEAHISADLIDNGADSTTKIASNSSRLGLKVKHELLNDLTILGQFEVGVDLTGAGSDDGNGGDYTNNAAMLTSARDSFIGIKSNKVGMLLAGNLPAVNQYMYEYNLFADHVGDLGNIWGAATSAIGIDRASDTIAYFIPDIIPGLSGDVAYVSDSSGNNNGNKVTAFLAKANYEISGLKVGVCYIAGTNDTNASVAAMPANTKPTDLAFTASYTMDNFSVGGGYLISDTKAAIDSKRKSWSAGGSYSMSGITLKAQYTATNNDTANSDSRMLAVGVDYALADDATVYLAYAKTTNDTGVSAKANNWGHGKSTYGAPTAGNNPKSFSLGLIYRFNSKIRTNN